MTVGEHVKTLSRSKVWLCPHIVKHPKFTPDIFTSGVECTTSTIPEPLKNKEVCKRYSDNGFECIIWKNDLEED